MFVTLTLKVLTVLRKNGYTVLTSVSSIADEDPVWYPQAVDFEELLDLDSEFMRRLSVPLQETHFLIIDDAIANIHEDYLIGQVFLEPMYANG